ncbi:DUF3616 domain-containing protein [Adhaeribacter pallidiroseus]|uniref:DUF3616 domain-containing protein n=1 Tax=Adhaeribacter pallidiroseus TaxID=2072847 RepID=A0A369QBD2_9BACT|nr:DUF3616 domain-containing protein [Adhaeribacter pallidiroseus]RDC61640.1 hypothetical protein AHMF7616_00220 [Adhaeribacter pallidiroseus]
MKKSTVKLQFNPELSINADGKHVRDGLSTILRTGDYLWVSCDERCSLERLKKIDENTFGEHHSFDLSQFLKLPAGTENEIDIEGIALEEHYLWLVGSHSLARRKPKKSQEPDEQIKRLAKLKTDQNRYLLARIPLNRNKETGEISLVKHVTHPYEPNFMLSAAQLAGNHAGTNQLLEALTNDIHVQDFLKIPGKDNGFDIEGLAIHGDRVFIGLRGPVLRGWAIILEVAVQDTDDSYFFELKPIGLKGELYIKHFLHLEGMGIRELDIAGDDLLILAGPSMDLDGTIALYRWPQALRQTGQSITHRNDLEQLFEVPNGTGPTSGQDKAEGITLFDKHHAIIVFDSPTDERKLNTDAVMADLFKIGVNSVKI